jgi:hypothetical protein
VVDDCQVIPVSLQQVLLRLGDDQASVPKSSYAHGIHHVMRNKPKARSVWRDDNDESEDDDDT